MTTLNSEPFLNYCPGEMEVVEEAVLPVELLCAFVTTANGGPKAGGSDCLIMSMNLAKNQGGSTSALWVSSLSMRKLFL